MKEISCPFQAAIKQKVLQVVFNFLTKRIIYLIIDVSLIIQFLLLGAKLNREPDKYNTS